jgi:hypothetical protein
MKRDCPLNKEVYTCFSCGSEDHISRNCPSTKESSSGKVFTGECECSTCGGSHASRHCWFGGTRSSNEITIKQVLTKPVDDSKVLERGGPSARMTILITTSPVPSNPSTDMLCQVIASFKKVKGLAECPIVITCDGCKLTKRNVWKAGKVTEDGATNYAEYIERLKALVCSNGGKIVTQSSKDQVEEQDSGVGTCGSGMKLVILEGRHSQALAVKAGLTQVSTPFVCVHQHDLLFIYDFGLGKALDVLEAKNDVEYVGMPLLCNLGYQQIVLDHHRVRVEPCVQAGINLIPVIFW